MHDTPKEIIPYESDLGRTLLPKHRSEGFQDLLDNFIFQYESHCGAASAVVVMNALAGEKQHTQDSLFTPETEKIIARDVVWEAGFTLEELKQYILTLTNFEVTATVATPDNLEDFLLDLHDARYRPNEFVIVNFSHNSLMGLGEAKGHFTPIWEYNEETQHVLLLEVSRKRQHAWIKAPDLHTAMYATDPVNGQPRGWLLVRGR